MAAPALALVVLDFNGLEDTRKCLRSMEAADLQGAPVILVDNGSAPETAAPIEREFPWAIVIRREENGGWAGGNNEGIRKALELGAKWILLLNNDVVVTPNIVERMLAAAEACPEFGIIGPLINFMDEPDVVMTDGVVFNPPGPPGSFFSRLVVSADRSSPPTVAKVDIVNGCALMISADTISKVGMVDERFFLIHEEADLCLRAVAAGIGCGVLAETLVWHKGSSSFKRTGSSHQRYYDSRNLVLLLAKHASTHQRGRSSLRSWFEYFRYVYYRWSIEHESGEHGAANAVVEGVLDGLGRRWGAYRQRRHRLRWLVTMPFSLVHRLQ